MESDPVDEVGLDLRAWREKVLNDLLVALVLGATPVIAMVFLEAARHPEQWPAAFAYLGIYLLIAALAALRRIGLRRRVWILLLLGHATAALAMARGGLAGDGRVYLMVIPAIASILLGARAALISGAVSLLIYALFANLASLGVLTRWLVRHDNPLRPDDWIFAGVTFAFSMAVLVTLQWEFNRFQADTARRQAKLLEVARASQARHRIISELVSDFAYALEVRPDGALVLEWITGAFTRITGFRAAEMLSDEEWERILHPDDRPVARESLQKLLSGQPHTAEFRVVTRGGKVRWLRNYARPVWSEEEERVVRIYGAAQDITLRKEAEEELEQTEHRFRAFTEANLAGVYVMQDGVVRYINPALCRMLGYEREEVVGRLGIDELIHPDDRGRIREQYRRRLGEEPIGNRYTLKALAKDGGTIYFEVLARRIEYEGRPAILGTVLDVTEQVEARERLERQVAQLALLKEVGGRVASLADTDTILQRAVDLIVQTFEYDHVAVAMLDEERGEVVMRARAGRYRFLFPLDHRLPITQGMVGWVVRNGRTLLANDVEKEPHYINCYPDRIPTRSEVTVPIRVGGRVIGVLDAQSRYLDAFGEADVLVLETVADQIAVAIENASLYESLERELEAKEQALEALRESESTARAILNTIDASVVLLDGDGTILAANTSAMNVLEKEGDGDVIGRHYMEVLGWRFRDVNRYLERALRTGRAIRFEREAGDRILHHGIYPILGDEGRVRRVVVMVTDVTERVRWEQRVARAERLAALGRLAATLAHEINNPLQVIQSHLELALDFPLPEWERRRFLEVVRQEVARLSRVTQTVLRAARPGGAVQEVVRVEDMVEQVLDLIRLRAERKGIEVYVVIRDDLPALLVVPDEIVQVLLNLLTNAVDAAPEGGWLRIEGGQADGLVELRVMNSGPTIPPEHLARLFDPFFTTKPDGLGLGLPFSQQVVERYGGTIQVQNLEDGEGVAFTVRLPAVSGEGPAEEE